MGKHVLITGGAGFIGSHLADELIARGHRVRAYDNLSPQVHGPNAGRPDYLNTDVELIVGDVRDREGLTRALRGIDVVYHLAAMVGVGQSMYEIAKYTEVNNMGTANLLEVLTQRPVQKLVVASSMSIYGEGLYRSGDGRFVPGRERTLAQLKRGDWEVRDDAGQVLEPVATPETKQPALPSIYALTKYDQERMCLIWGRAYGVPTVALRYFNVYGPRQALSNPYTGVLAIFAARLLNGRSPLVNEDGRQRRDFVNVHDIARASRQVMEVDAADGQALNIGSGVSYSIREIGERVAAALDRRQISPQITRQYRFGDIRNCFPDISRARQLLGYEPAVSLDEGLAELGGWLRGRTAEDRVEAAREELTVRGLAI